MEVLVAMLDTAAVYIAADDNEEETESERVWYRLVLQCQE